MTGLTTPTLERPTVEEVALAIEEWAPCSLAAEWDNVGLQVGRGSAGARRILLAVDPSDAVVKEAVDGGFDLLISHHPLFLRPLSSLSERTPEGTRALRLVEAGIALYTAHTNLDAAPSDGTSDALAEALGCFRQIRPARGPRAVPMYKLVTFCPVGHEEDVFEAMSAAGAGRIGAYSGCSFRSPGLGTFFGEAGTHPRVGEPGRLERVEEVRLEMIVPGWALGAVVEAMMKSHPYEEVAHDIYPLHEAQHATPFARLGELERRMSLGALAETVSERISSAWPRMVGDEERTIERVAVCGGSGGSVIDDVCSAGAEALITGEFGHHDALKSLDLGLCLIGVGHHTSERPVLNVVARRLSAKFGETTDVRIAACDGDPICSARMSTVHRGRHG